MSGTHGFHSVHRNMEHNKVFEMHPDLRKVMHCRGEAYLERNERVEDSTWVIDEVGNVDTRAQMRDR